MRVQHTNTDVNKKSFNPNYLSGKKGSAREGRRGGVGGTPKSPLAILARTMSGQWTGGTGAGLFTLREVRWVGPPGKGGMLLSLDFDIRLKYG